MEGENITIQWSVYEHEHIERGSDWYWALGILAVCGALTSILFGNILFALVIVLSTVTLGIAARHPPILADIELSDAGVRINHRLHKFEDIISFWVEKNEHGTRPLLLVDTKKWLAPNLIIPIEHVEPALVRAYLKERTKEVRMHEPVSHKILALFGF